MPKKSLKINQFHGGLNNFRDRRDTPEDALVNASNVMVDIPGKIRQMGRDLPFNELTGTIVISGAVTPGYGLFAFKADHAFNGDVSNNGKVFVIYQNGNDFNVAQDQVVYSPGGENEGGFATGWENAINVDFFYLNERLFMSDGNFTNNNMPIVYQYINHQRFTTLLGSDHYNNSAQEDKLKVAKGWHINNVNYPSLAENKFTTNLAATVTTSTITDGVVVSLQNDSAVAGDWEDQYIWLGISNVYNTGEESRIMYDSATDAVDTRELLSGGMGALKLSLSLKLDLSGSTTSLDKRHTGFKIYVLGLSASSAANFYKDPLLLATADMVAETITSHDGLASDWKCTAAAATNNTLFNSAVLTISTIPTSTFEIENLYAYDVPTIKAKWKCSTVMGNQVFIGNIRTYENDDTSATEITQPDRILRVMPPPLSTRAGIFPSTDFLEIASGDGDEIIQLETFSDRLLVFKRNTVYIVNISGDTEYIEEEHKFIGVGATYNVASTEFGIAWVNDKGAYLYTGDKVINLLEGKIDPYIDSASIGGSLDAEDQMPGWSNFIGSSGGQIGYLPEDKHLIIFDTPHGDSNTQGNLMIHDFKTGSWTYSTDRISSGSRSNIINNINKNCLFMGNISSGVNLISTTVLAEGTPFHDWVANISGLSDYMVTPAETEHQLLLTDPSNTVPDIPLTTPFTWSLEEKLLATDTTSAGPNIAQKIMLLIGAYVDDSSTNSISTSWTGTDRYDMVLKFIAPDYTVGTVGTSSTPPVIFGKEVIWNTAEGFAVPASGSLLFYNSGIGNGIAPVRAWYQQDMMTGHNNYGAHEDNQDIQYNGLIHTWGSHYKGRNPVDDDGSFSGNTMHAYFVNNGLNWSSDGAARKGIHSPVYYALHYLCARKIQDVVDNSYWGLDGEYSEGNIETSRHWMLGTGTDDNYDWKYNESEQREERDFTTNPLYSYTGFVLNPLGGKNMVTFGSLDNDSNYNQVQDYNCNTEARTNPRLIRYMCNFSENLAAPGDNYFSPNAVNGGSYVSPGYVWTQSFSQSQEEFNNFMFDQYEQTPQNSGNNKFHPVGMNGMYSPHISLHQTSIGSADSNLQSDTIWPNGYFYFGVGTNDLTDSKIVEGVGPRAPLEGGNLKDASMQDPDCASFTDSDLFANHYFIGWQHKWDTNSGFPDNQPAEEGSIETFIAKDIFGAQHWPNERSLFWNFGDMVYRQPGTKESITGERGYYGYTDSYFDGLFTPSHQGMWGTGNSIPFNAGTFKSTDDSDYNHGTDHCPPITRDEAFIVEPDTIGHNGIPIISKRLTKAKDNIYGYMTPHATLINGESVTNISMQDRDAVDAAGVGHLHEGDFQYRQTFGEANYPTPHAVSYSSIPYLVIELTPASLVLHFTCKYDQNKSVHKVGKQYSWTLPDNDFIIDDGNTLKQLYEAEDMILSDWKVIDVYDNIQRTHNSSGSDSSLSTNLYEGQEYDPIHKFTWGVNGYCKLTFNRSDQSSGNQSHIDHMLEYGNTSFWHNPLKSEDMAYSDSDLSTNHAFWAPIVKDTTATDPTVELTDIVNDICDANDSSGVAWHDGHDNLFFEHSGLGSELNSDMFSAVTFGQNGHARELIMHNKRDINQVGTAPLQVNFSITKTNNFHSPIQKSIGDIKWESGDYDDPLDINLQLIADIDGNMDMLSQAPITLNFPYGGTVYPKIQHNLTASGAYSILIRIADYDIETQSEYYRSLADYVDVGDILYFSSSSIRYLVGSIEYDSGSGFSTVNIDDTTYTHAAESDTSIFSLIHAADHQSTDGLTTSAVYFKDVLSATNLSSDFYITGEYSGSLKVLQFNNSSTFADTFNNTSEYPLGGNIFIETKDYDFGNLSNLKNINYIDISLKGRGFSNFTVKYAINNGNGFGDNETMAIADGYPNISGDVIEAKTFRFQFLNPVSGLKTSLKNCNSIRLRIEAADVMGFELNDITFVYREKIL